MLGADDCHFVLEFEEERCEYSQILAVDFAELVEVILLKFKEELSDLAFYVIEREAIGQSYLL